MKLLHSYTDDNHDNALVILDTILFSTNEISEYKEYIWIIMNNQCNNQNLAVFTIICIDLSHDVIDSCVVTFDFWYNSTLNN